jgi:arginyl-tRNA synthetase
MRLYREAKVRFDEDAGFKARAQAAVVALQAGDPASVRRWESICKASRVEFQALYDALGVRLEERGESFYNPLLAPLVEDLVRSGVAEVSEGATCVFVEGDDVPLIIQKSDGGFGYGTTDMAALRQRLEEERADWVIYVTDQGQSGHFDKVFKAARKAGWVAGAGDGGSEDGPRIEHVAFGLVLGEDGKRLRTRSGDVVRLADLLAEAVARCRVQLLERAPDMGPAEIDRAAKAMGHAAVKYADLRQNRQTDYTFSYDRMTDLKGDTAVYLLYAYARVCSILRKAGPAAEPSRAAQAGVTLQHEAEQRLALQLVRFPEAVEAVLADLAPNRLCAYVMDLSTAFTEFYSQCQVLGEEQEASRLALCLATRNVMGQCFDLLGIEPLERI